MTTRLENRIMAMIRDQGPMRLDHFMGLCLSDPDEGYYRRQDPLGREGDFTTAPEISQMFGELVSLWLYDEALKQGIAETAGLVELGPGRGSLMADALRCLNSVAPERQWPVHLLEISPGLIKAQEQNLATAANASLHWMETLEALPEQPLLIIANEFFDALPVRQFRALGGQWHERLVDLADDGLTLTESSDPIHLDGLPEAGDDGVIAEHAPDLAGIIASLAQHIERHGGAMLIFDYGKNGATGDSLQAVQQHRPRDILHEPGLTDLSAWVDFAAIADHARHHGIAPHGPAEQGTFLKAIGLYARAEQLATGATPETRREIAAAVDRLSSPAQMGTAFKVMALRPRDAAMPVAGL
ncbi:MAG: class I SAM-dependent methyltransferase [Candidatus Puniceispirillales bacterium]